MVVCLICAVLYVGISLVDESEPVVEGAHSEIAPGIHAAYNLPVAEEVVEGSSDSADANISLEELMAQMKSM